MSDTKSFLVVLHLPSHLVGQPVSEIERVLRHPANDTIGMLAREAHRCINNPDLSLHEMVSKLHDERLREALGER